MASSSESRPSGPEKKGWWQQHRFKLLLAVLLVDILIAPVVASIEAPRHPKLGASLVLVALTAMVFVAGFSAAGRGVSRYMALGLGVPTLVLAWLGIFSDQPMLMASTWVFTILFLGLVIVLLVRQVFRERIVTLDVISASLCAYLLIGLGWAAAYGLVEMWEPNSFHLPDDGFSGFLAQDIDASVRRVYFSFVTLLTLGYGDLVPVGSIARLSAVIEAFVGQVFLVVLIARLVALNVGQEMSTPPSSET
jgi:hypothetical protein